VSQTRVRDIALERIRAVTFDIITIVENAPKSPDLYFANVSSFKDAGTSGFRAPSDANAAQRAWDLLNRARLNPLTPVTFVAEHGKINDQ